MTPSFEIQAATDDDAGPLSEFLNTCTLAHQGIARSSPADVVARLHMVGSDPATDSFVARDEDGIIGFAHLWPHSHDEIKLFARTHTDEQGRGVGSRLVSLGDRRAAQLLPTARCTATSWAADVRAPELLEGHGYRPVRYFVRMEIDAGGVAEEAPLWPAGVGCVPLSKRPDLESALFAAWSDAFADEWGSRASSEREFWEERRDSKRGSAFPFDATLWLLALGGDLVIGFCLCEIGAESVGRVSEIGVVSSQRDAGVGYALLLSGLRELRRRGAARVVLDVDAENVTSALRLYRKAGMTPEPAFTVWERRVRTPAAVPSGGRGRRLRP